MRKHSLSILALAASCLAMNVSADRLPADPTKPPTGYVEVKDVAEPASQFKLNSLMTGKKQSFAVVNGQRVTTGDKVDGAEVLSISRQGVKLDVAGEQRLITLAKREGFSKTKSGK